MASLTISLSRPGALWFYFQVYDPDKGTEFCGTGGYFNHLGEAIEWASEYDRRRVKGHKRLLPCRILNVHHEVIQVVGRLFNLKHIRLNQGGYTDEGVYFGVGQPLYHYCDWEGQKYGFIRADSREQAKERIRCEVSPGAQFYR